MPWQRTQRRARRETASRSSCGWRTPSPAIAWYDRTVAVDANYCYAYFHKARSLEELGRIDDACAALRMGIERARTAGDRHALSELSGYLDQLS
jgi:hypothetical protein